MFKHICVALFVSIGVAGLGCATLPEDPEGDGEDFNVEDVEEAEQAIMACPQLTECNDACAAIDLAWFGNCKDSGQCWCRPEEWGHGGPVGGSGFCYIDWSLSTLPTGYEPFGEWVCTSPC